MLLSPKQVAFDAAVRALPDVRYLGIADVESISDDALRHSLTALRDIFNAALVVEGQHIIGDAPHAPFYLDYIDSVSPAALAFKDAEHSFVGITFPFVLQLWNVAGRVTASDAVVARIGVPAGYDRVAVRRALFFMQFGFVLAHEVTHHTHGHFPAPQAVENNLRQQARELDADGWATALTLNNYLLESGRPLAVEFLNLAYESESAQDDVILASFFAAHASMLFDYVPPAIDVNKMYEVPHPPLPVRHDMVSVFALKFMDDHRPSLRATMTKPRYLALMNDTSQVMWSPTHAERWKEHHRFMRAPDGKKYRSELVDELDAFRVVLRQWQADAYAALASTS